MKVTLSLPAGIAHGFHILHTIHSARTNVTIAPPGGQSAHTPGTINPSYSKDSRAFPP
jgi:hypothetical protein